MLLNKLKSSFPDIVFEPGKTFVWSPKSGHVIYKDDLSQDDEVASWSLLHEVGHALLGHNNYESDFQLLTLEVAAWDKAKELAKQFGYKIDSEHIEDCLDTYREWLYQRSTCPHCTSASLQQDNHTYSCFNCGTVWHVSSSRMCRPYRRTHTPLRPVA